MITNSFSSIASKEEKSIEKVIEDKEKRILLKHVVEGIEEKEDQYKRDKKAYIKELERLNLNRSATPEQFLIVTDKMHQINQEAFDFMVLTRLTIGGFITVEEWDAIIADGKNRYHKTKTKYEKAYPDFEKVV